MANQLDYSEKVTTGPNGGSYELRVKNFGSLQRKNILKTGIFNIGGYNWRVGVCRCFPRSCSSETLQLFLLSCNATALCPDITLRVVNQRDPQRSLVKREMSFCPPFGVGVRENCIDYETLKDPAAGFVVDGRFVVTVGLQHMRVITTYLVYTEGDDMRLINLEVIESRILGSRLSERKFFGITSVSRKRSAVVLYNELVTCHEYRTQVQKFHYRYWLCGRSANGAVHIKRCLKGCPNTCFGEICEPGIDSHGHVTLFAERNCDGNFQAITANTIVLFCKLYVPHEDQLYYRGYFLVEKTERCIDLYSKLAVRARIPAGRDCDLYVEVDQLGVRKVIGALCTLAEEGLTSGCVLVLREREIGEVIPEDTVQDELLSLYTRGLDISSDEDNDEADSQAPMEGQEEDAMCVVCWAAPKSAGFVHANEFHKCVCHECAQAVMQEQSALCPMCRQPVDHVILRTFN